tara:strand:- start:13 stop:426 length:414 start_codon:yes stop_codon:yes gene_type:complete
MLEEIINIKSSSKDLRSFGITFSIISLIIASFLYFSNALELFKIFTYIGLVFIVLGYIIPIALKPLYFVWMIIAIVLGWVMTRVILSIVFYLVITPIGIITRILGEDFLSLKNSETKSYWNNRDSIIENNQDYEKQF